MRWCTYSTQDAKPRVGLVDGGAVGTGCILELTRTDGAGDYPWLAPGDVVTLAVEHLGQITARVPA